MIAIIGIKLEDERMWFGRLILELNSTEIK
jgi:hypothetical protein